MATPLASLLPNGKQQFIDQNGVPLVGGSVYFYIPSTTTPKNTWQDSQEVVLNTNPIILDSYGQAVIYGSGQYRQVVKDINGNTIWDQLTQDILGVLGTAAYENIGANLKDDGSGNLVSKITTSQNITAATTTDLGSLTTDVVNITGNTTITSFGSSSSIANPIYFLTFSGTPLLTYNATSLILPSAANIQTAAGDTAIAQYLGSGNWRVFSYQTASGESIINQTPIGSFRGLKGIWASTTTATFTATQLTLINASFKSVSIQNYGQTLSTSASGAGGLDTGTLAASTFYYVYSIYNGSTQNILFSLSSTAPTLPTGYNYFLRVGSFQTDSSKNIIGFVQYGNRVSLVVGNNLANLPILISGVSGDPSIPTYTSVAVSGVTIPTTAGIVILVAGGNGGGATVVASNPNKGPLNSSTNPPDYSTNSGSGGVTTNPTFPLVLESSNIYYAATTSTSFAACSGWEDNL